jgi:hypothetical protein
MRYKAEVWIEGQLVECFFEAQELFNAWSFAVVHFYPEGSTKQMRVSRVKNAA